MENLKSLGQKIDLAIDSSCSSELEKLAEKCKRYIEVSTEANKPILWYFLGNCFAGLSKIRLNSEDDRLSWKLPETVEEIFALRSAVQYFSSIALEKEHVSQIRTNLGNSLSFLGRPVAAIEQWHLAIEAIPQFAKAYCNRGIGVQSYALGLYDPSHTLLALSSAQNDFEFALSTRAYWENEDFKSYKTTLAKRVIQIKKTLSDNGFNENFDLDAFEVGATFEEREYRVWCLDNRLFLNPLNDILTRSVVAQDVLHLPDHVYKQSETPRFPVYFNIIKQEFVSARYEFYTAVRKLDLEYIMKDVLLIDTGENHKFGHYTAKFRYSFRSIYSIFDKIALFLNDYFQLGKKVGKVTIKNVWYKNQNTQEIHEKISESRNWFLRGLYFVSLDLWDKQVVECSEPLAESLATLRHQLEHRFVSFVKYETKESTEYNLSITIEEFSERTLKLLKLAREAIIYLSLMMRQEEIIRESKLSDENSIHVDIPSWPIEEFSS